MADKTKTTALSADAKKQLPLSEKKPARKREPATVEPTSELTTMLDSYGDQVRIRELVHNETKKFWRIELARKLDCATFRVSAGKVGSEGRVTKHVFDGWKLFAVAARNAIRRQLRAGYVEVTKRPKLSAKQMKDIRLLDSHYCGPARFST